MVLRVTPVKLESLGSKVPEAFQEPQAERENLGKVPMYTAQHSVWDWRDRSLSPCSVHPKDPQHPNPRQGPHLNLALQEAVAELGDLLCRQLI